MAVRFIEGFDHYTAGDSAKLPDWAAFLKKWTGNTGNTFSSSSVLFGSQWGRQMGGQGMRIEGNNQGYVYKIVPATATGVVGAAVYFPTAVPTTNNIILVLMDGTSEQLSVRGNGSGALTVTRNGTVLATSTNILSTGVWYYIELKATIHNTAGVIQLRVNNVDWIASTGALNTRNTAANQTTGPAFGTTAGAAVMQMDDLYFLDATTGTNIDFLGPCTVGILRPVAPGNYADWTSNGGNNFGNVSDTVGSDGDTTFNQSATAGQIDSHIFSDLPAASGNVYAIQHVIYAKQDAGAQRQIAPLQRSSGTNYPGTTVTTAGSYQYLLEVRDTNPATSAAWTVAEVNAAEFGLKLIS